LLDLDVAMMEASFFGCGQVLAGARTPACAARFKHRIKP
jgi:hypothetical protein